MSIRRSLHHFNPGLAFMLLTGLLLLLLVAGGASRADVLGQAVARGGAAAALVIALLFVGRLAPGSAKPVFYFILASIALVALQLVPLPPGLWQSLPGRSMFLQAVDGPQPWRPWSIVPDASTNALHSLLVPLATLVLAVALGPLERDRLPALVLGVIAASMLVGLLQFSGTNLRSPLLNLGSDVSGSFANRNHFALFMAMGCLVAPVWAFPARHEVPWRGFVALGLVLLFLLLILASGARTGMILGAIAIVIGLVLARDGLRRALRRAPRWALPVLVGATLAVIALFVAISIVSNRAESVNRAMKLEAGEDLRFRSLPKTVEIVTDYFPAGSGFGSFDQIFRIHEPFGFLKLTYFNHAHNDFLEIALDGGLPALLLLTAALAWWVFASVRVWRRPPSTAVMQGRLGSAMLLLVLIASAVDYPARTPMVMAMVALSAVWLCWGCNAPDRSALPKQIRNL
jgi:O-antigen ligase